MSRVLKTVVASGANGFVIDLGGSVGWLKLTAFKSGGGVTMTAKPVFVPEGGTAPSAPSGVFSTNADGSQDCIALLSDSAAPVQSAEIGQKFAPGYNQDAQGVPVATHVLIWAPGAGTLTIQGE
jgi:hypothetical protein